MKKSLYIIILGILIGLLAGWIFFSGSKAKEREKAMISNHTEIVNKIEVIGKLELVRVHVQDIMEHQKIRQWLPNAKAILIIHGEAAGCIDLTQMNPDNILISGDTISLVLPAPELCYCKIDHSKSKVFDTQNNFFSGAKLIDEAYREAENHLRRSVLKAGILDETKDNAIQFFAPFFQGLGYNHTIILFENDFSINR